MCVCVVYLCFDSGDSYHVSVFFLFFLQDYWKAMWRGRQTVLMAAVWLGFTYVRKKNDTLCLITWSAVNTLLLLNFLSCNIAKTNKQSQQPKLYPTTYCWVKCYEGSNPKIPRRFLTVIARKTTSLPQMYNLVSLESKKPWRRVHTQQSCLLRYMARACLFSSTGKTSKSPAKKINIYLLHSAHCIYSPP